jgi:hypothetical protein
VQGAYQFPQIDDSLLYGALRVYPLVWHEHCGALPAPPAGIWDQRRAFVKGAARRAGHTGLKRTHLLFSSRTPTISYVTLSLVIWAAPTRLTYNQIDANQPEIAAFRQRTFGLSCI